MSHIFNMSTCAIDYSASREDFFRELLKFSLSTKRKSRGLRVVDMNESKDHLKAWIFVANPDFATQHSCRTFPTFKGWGELWGEYFTPNGFYNRHRREKRWLRQLNALFVDIDMAIAPDEVVNLIKSVCLPLPSAVIRTPGGGCHIYWFLDKPIPGTQKAVHFYESLQRDIAFVLGGDRQAIGAERLMRIPRRDLTHYWDLNKRYALQDFANWRTQYLPDHNSRVVYFSGEHPGVKVLLDGVDEGIRNCSAFALSLHFKCMGMELNWTLDRLARWNLLNNPPLGSMELEYIIQRVYDIERYRIYPFKLLSTLSGIEAKGVIRTPRKTREERQRIHYEEWINDIHTMLLTADGMLITSVRAMARRLGVSRGSIEKVLLKMKEDYTKTYKIYIIGKGNRQRTVIQLLLNAPDPKPDDSIPGLSLVKKPLVKNGECAVSYSRVHVSTGGWVGSSPVDNLPRSRDDFL